jgi:hypothetical protein
MNKMIGWLIGIGGAAFILDKLGYIDLSTIFGGTVVPTDGTSSSPQANNPQQAVQNTTLGLLHNAVVADGRDPQAYMSVSEWNVYYKLARGVNGPAPQDLFPDNPNADTQKFSIGEYWNAMTHTGFSGLGIIAHFVNPYLSGPRAANVAFGANLMPTGPETMIKRIN